MLNDPIHRAKIKRLDTLIESHTAAYTAAMEALKELYPVGAIIGVILKDSQIVPTEATVIDYKTYVHEPGYIRVCLHKSKMRSIKDIHYTKIPIIYSRPAHE